MKTLLLLTFLISSAAFAQPFPQRIYPASCQGVRMFSNFNTEIYRFTFSSDCEDALFQSRGNFGRFCDDEKLIRENGQLAREFTFSSDCSDALSSLRSSRYGLFCDRDVMVQVYRGAIADLTFSSNCQIALSEAAQFRGLFCNRGQMMMFTGQPLRDYTFESQCRQALPEVSRQVGW